MTFETEAARLTPLFLRAEREHRDLTSLFKEGGSGSPAYDDLLGRLRADTERIEKAADEIRDGLRAADPNAADTALAFLSTHYRAVRTAATDATVRALAESPTAFIARRARRLLAIP